MKPAQLSSIRFLQIMMVGSIGLPFVLFTYASWLNYRAAYQAADERIDRSLTIVHEQASYLLRSTELLLTTANRLVGSLPDEEITKNEKKYHLVLEEIAATLPQVYSLRLFAADGTALVSSNTFPVPKSLTNSDRDYFRAQVTRDVGTFIGEVVKPKIVGDPIFSLSRRRVGQPFNGVVAAAIRPLDVQSFYEAIGKLPGSYYAMLRDDGSFLARYPAPVALNLRLSENSATRRSIAVHPKTAIISLKSQTDGVDRRIGYLGLQGFPIYVLAGIENAAIVSDWIHSMTSHLIFGVPATAVMFFALSYGMRRTRRLYAEAARREEAEGVLRQTQKMESIGQLTGGVAHDFNNLLMIVIGNLGVAKKALEAGLDMASARAFRAVENALHGAQRAATLTQRLLAFSRQQPLAPIIIDVNAIVKEAAELLRRALGESHQLEIVSAAGAWNIEADTSQLEVALLNLVINSRDALPAGGKITVECSNAFLDESYCQKFTELRSGQYVMISVTDNGCGMPAATLSRVFDPFFTTKPAGQGTGLGLSQVYGFVKQSGGHVAIYSELGQGTTVKMYFPRAYFGSTASLQDERVASLQLGKGERILVVEDDPDVRNYVRETLNDLKYDVEEAATGDAALALIRNSGKAFAAVITDVVMPGLNGRELAEHICASNPTIKIIYMTGYSRNAIVHQGRLDPGVILLQKPFSREDLAARLRKVLD